MKDNQKKVIVTGGMGYIGSHTVIELIENGFEPVIFDNLSNSDISTLDRIESITNVKVEFEQIDLKHEIETKEVFKKYSGSAGVIHFAALKAVGESVEIPNEYYRNNVNSLLNVLDSMKIHEISNIIFSSSCTVYGQAEVLPVTEETPIQNPESPYGFSKVIGERIVQDYSYINENIQGVSLRYFNPIGAHKSALLGELPNGVPNNLLPYITQTVSGQREYLSVFGTDYNTHDGTPIRDYLHVVDLADAHIKALNRLLEGKSESAHEIYNIGTGQGYSVFDVINAFEKSNGLKVNYKLAPRRDGDVETVYGDPSLANAKLNWKAQRSLEEMTRSAWAWQQHYNSNK